MKARRRKSRSGAFSDVASRTTHVPLTQGKFALIDAEDWDVVAEITWSYGEVRPGYGYAMSKINRRTARMHNLILPVAKGLMVDHANHNTLDNRRLNLRCATRSQNFANSRRNRNSTTGYKGVTFYPRLGKWQAHIQRSHLGMFETPEAAALAYDAAAREVFGEFAQTNAQLSGVEPQRLAARRVPSTGERR